MQHRIHLPDTTILSVVFPPLRHVEQHTLRYPKMTTTSTIFSELFRQRWFFLESLELLLDAGFTFPFPPISARVQIIGGAAAIR